VKQKICVLASGGLDSSVLLTELSRSYQQVFPLFIRCGLRWDDVELTWLERFIAATKITAIESVHVMSVDLSSICASHWSVAGVHVPQGTDTRDSDYLPARNLLLLSCASVFCSHQQIDTVATGHLQHNPHPDGGDAFFESFQKTASIGLGRPLMVLTPYRNLDKSDVIRRAGTAPLELTFTCLNPADMGHHCGTCQHCYERRKAFHEAEVRDPTPYRI
jgi:7-cyano-7-deazaguanine synthase